MFRFRSISGRLVVTISLILMAACGGLGGFSVMQQRSLTRLALDQQLQLQYNSVTAALDYEGRTAMAVSSTIAALPPVKETIVNGERDVLMALLGGVNDVLKQQGIRYVNVTLSPATIFLRVHDPKVFGDDVSARRTAIVQANKTGKAIVGVEQGRDILNIYAMTPIMKDGQSLAVIDIGIPLGPEFVNRAKQRFGVDLAVHSFDGKAFNTTASTFGDAVIATPDELKSALGGQPVRRDAVLGGHAAALYLGQIKNSAGQPVAVLELIKDTSEYEAAAASAQLDLVIGTMAILTIAVFLALLLGRGLSRPVTALTGTMNRLSSGDTDVVIPGHERHDELGTMAKAVDVFRRGMIEARALRESQEAMKQQAEMEKHKALHVMADNFESTIGRVIETVTSAATELQAASGQMAGTAAEASSQATSVATSAQLASSNVQTVASATEQLAASIQEIAQQVERSQIVSSRADEEAVNTTGHIQALSDDVGKIGEIVNLINTIAGQTNLLALNATIEAARAGDAGKGFAVVAGEVKNLANQTGRATSEISSRILAVQQSTDRAVEAVHSISKVISEMGGISTAVAAAVEEQSSATSEISRNVEQAAGGTEQVSRNIVSVEQAARDTGMAAQQIKESSLDLSKQAEFLRREVDQFLTEVRADRQA